MKQKTRTYKQLLLYIVLFFAVLVVDRITKYGALSLTQPLKINSFLTFDLTFNRGVSWGMLQTENSSFFIMLTVIISCITVLLGWYALMRWRQGLFIGAEVLAFGGACSNIIDRLLYGGVIDFIVLSIKNCALFGVFNIADMCIVCGIFLIFFLAHLEREKI